MGGTYPASIAVTLIPSENNNISRKRVTAFTKIHQVWVSLFFPHTADTSFTRKAQPEDAFPEKRNSRKKRGGPMGQSNEMEVSRRDFVRASTVATLAAVGRKRRIGLVRMRAEKSK